MARVGSFGRRRANNGGSLTSIIASLYREQQSQNDQNIFDAWKNGGQFQGKPVTDARLVAYITSRRNSYTKDDPLWDQWNDTLTQTNFSIGEQKISLEYKQGKVGASAVAAFYKGQLAKIPKDSQFYRDVAGRAADWAKAGVSAARSAGRRRASASLDAKLAKSQGDAALYDAATSFIEQAARRAGLIFGSRATWADANAEKLIELVNGMGATLPDGRKLTYATWQQLALKRAAAYDSEIRIKEAAGRTTKTLRNQRAKFVGTTLGDLNALDDRSQYETLHQKFEEDVQSAHNDPARQLEITRDYVSSLQKLYGRASSATGDKANSVDFIGALNNEIQSIQTGKVVGPNAYDLFENRTTGESTTRIGDMQSTIESLYGDPTKGTLGAVQKNDGLQSGTMYYGQTKYGEPPDVHSYDASTPSGLNLDQTEAVILVDGEPRTVVMAGKPVEGAQYKDKNGDPIDPSKLSPEELRAKLFNGEIVKDNQATIGYVYDNPTQPGQRFYGVYAPSGVLQFTTENPFTGTQSPDGTFVLGPNGVADVTNAVPFAQAQPGQVAATSVAVSPDLTSDQLIQAGHNVLDAGGNQAAAQALIDLGVSKQSDARRLQLIGVNSQGEYTTPLTQIQSLNAAEAADRSPASSLVVNKQTYLQSPAAMPGIVGKGYAPSLPPSPQPSISVPPTIKVPNPPVGNVTPKSFAPPPPPAPTINPQTGATSGNSTPKDFSVPEPTITPSTNYYPGSKSGFA
jgi:hypothetical protein